MYDRLYSLLKPSLAKRPKVGSHKLFDMLHQEHKDRFAKDPCRAVPLLDNGFDKACLNHERVAAGELSRAGSSIIKYYQKATKKMTLTGRHA
jgi:hypothetical protein